VDANSHNNFFLKKIKTIRSTLVDPDSLHNFHPHPRALLFPSPDNFHPRALLFPQNSKSKPLDLSPLSRLMFPLPNHLSDSHSPFLPLALYLKLSLTLPFSLSPLSQTLPLTHKKQTPLPKKRLRRAEDHQAPLSR
jgi:hypothetical protein